MESKYKSGKSVGKNQTVPISADDPRLAWNKVGQTKARQGAEIDIIGLDGKSLVAGGTTANNASGGSVVDKNNKSLPTFIPPSNGKPGSIYSSSTIVPTDPTNVTAVWSGEDLVVSFDWDYENELNSTVSNFILELTADGVTRRTSLTAFVPNMTQVGQQITLTKALNAQTFGVFRTSITAICVLSIDPLYNTSNTVCAAVVPTYVLNLPVPVIVVSAITGGYSVSYTTPTQSAYDAIEIVEYESTSSTEPTGVTYSTSFWGTLNPANIIAPNINARWVKARFSSSAGQYTAFSAAQKVTPTSPVSIDNTPPNEVVSVSAAWSNDDIVVSYTLPSTDPAARVQIQLTAPNNLVGYFYRFPSGSGTSQTTTITKKDLFDQFGSHYSSYTGLLKSVDAADNKSSGVSFNVATRANPLVGVTPTFSVIALSNAYSINFTLPTGAVYAEVYAKHTPWTGDPVDDEFVVYAGLSPAVVTDTDYTPVYIKLHYYDDFGNTSNYSAEGITEPLNPGEITSFENPISFGANAVIYAGVSPIEGTRTLFKTGGIFAYDSINTAPSTQIISDAVDGTPTFITTQAQIADWKISETKIENTLAGTPSKYVGLSASGPYSFWAGSDITGGDAEANFSVTPAGAVRAKNIYISGNGTNNNLMNIAGLFVVKNDGSLTATAATIIGNITASSGAFTGNVSIGSSGSLYSGTLSGNNIVGAGYILNTSGIIFNSSTVNGITSINGSTGELITAKALIGGWTVSDVEISKTTSGQGKIKLDSANGRISVSNDTISTNLAGINSPTLLTDSVFWSGGSTPNATTNAFRVTLGGSVYAKDISVEGGRIGDNSTNYWEITSIGIKAHGTGNIELGNYQIRSSGGEFLLFDNGTSTSVIATNSVSGATDPKRIFLGDTTRQVEVAKSAQISGTGTIGHTYEDVNAYRSGGLRNMFTVSKGQYDFWGNFLYPDAMSGDVLLVYDPAT